MNAFYSDTFVLPLPEGHRFPMTNTGGCAKHCSTHHVLDESDLVVPAPAEWDDIRLAHCASYVEAVANGTLTAEAQRRIGFPWSPGMVERSRRSVGATIAAARHVMAAR